MKPRAARRDTEVLDAEVLATFGRHLRVRSDDGRDWQAVTRGRKTDVACGDRVAVRVQSADQCVIESVHERRNLVFRSDQYRQKLIAANIDQIVIVLATEPSYSDDLLSRALVAAEVDDVPALIVLNKIELPSLAAARARVAPYAALGYRVLETSFKTAPEAALAQLRPALADKTSVVLGQSGMGKSTLVNLLVPGAAAATREISDKLDSGKHTTTSAQIYAGEGFRLVDSPGFQEFGLAHLDVRTLENAFVEFRPHLGGCKFYNCQHLDEPGCAISAAAASGAIGAARYALYRQLHSELKQHLPDYA